MNPDFKKLLYHPSKPRFCFYNHKSYDDHRCRCGARTERYNRNFTAHECVRCWEKSKK